MKSIQKMQIPSKYYVYDLIENDNFMDYRNYKMNVILSASVVPWTVNLHVFQKLSIDIIEYF